MTSGWSAAAASIDITPHAFFPLAGYAARSGVARGTLQPLEANVLILAAGSVRFVWVTLDVLAIMPATRRAITERLTERCGLRPDEVVIVASHTHSAPAVWTGSIHPVLPAEIDKAELARVASLIADATRGLLDAGLRRAEMSYGQGKVTGAGANRHRIDGPHDNSTQTLCVSVSDGPIAVVFDYACHPTVLSAENLLYSPDWVGGARSAIREEIGRRDASVLYLPGPGGDVSTRFARRSHVPEEATRIGRIVGEAVITAVRNGCTDADTSLRAVGTVFESKTRTSFDDLAFGTGTDNVDSGELEDSFADARASIAAYQSASVPPVLPVTVTEVRVGRRRYVHTPFEVGSTLAPQMVGRSLDAPRLIGYTDGYNGYLADEESFRVGHYEAAMSFLDLAETESVVDQVAAFVTRVS